MVIGNGTQRIIEINKRASSRALPTDQLLHFFGEVIVGHNCYAGYRLIVLDNMICRIVVIKRAPTIGETTAFESCQQECRSGNTYCKYQIPHPTVANSFLIPVLPF